MPLMRIILALLFMVTIPAQAMVKTSEFCTEGEKSVITPLCNLSDCAILAVCSTQTIDGEENNRKRLKRSNNNFLKVSREFSDTYEFLRDSAIDALLNCDNPTTVTARINCIKAHFQQLCMDQKDQQELTIITPHLTELKSAARVACEMAHKESSTLAKIIAQTEATTDSEIKINDIARIRELYDGKKRNYYNALVNQEQMNEIEQLVNTEEK